MPRAPNRHGRQFAALRLSLDPGVGPARRSGFETSVWLGLLGALAAGLGTALLLAAIYRVRAVRRLAMELMHRITGQ
jgi:hypothetical protein